MSDEVDVDLQRKQDEYFQSKLAKGGGTGISVSSPLVLKKDRTMPLPMLNIGQEEMKIQYIVSSPKRGKNLAEKMRKTRSVDVPPAAHRAAAAVVVEAAAVVGVKVTVIGGINSMH